MGDFKKFFKLALFFLVVATYLRWLASFFISSDTILDGIAIIIAVGLYVFVAGDDGK